MKRLWISSFLLLAIFAGTLYNTTQIGHITQQLSSRLEQSQAAASQGDWDTAQQLTLEALDHWEQVENYFSVVLCHADTDEVDTAFQEVLGFLRYRSAPEYTSSNRTLLEKVKHLAEIEKLNWNNVL